MRLGSRAVLVVAISVATAAPASAATLHLDAPREIDRAEKFRVVATGEARPQRDYYVSVLYHDDDQGRCARTMAREVTRNEHSVIFSLRKVVTDAEGRFEARSRRILGGDRKTSGRFCGYLTNEDGTRNKDRAVRRIEFT